MHTLPIRVVRISDITGVVMGGISWFAIPWLAATTMGLSCLALELTDAFPGFPARMADADVTSGLVLPNAAVAMLGQGGAAATLLLIFMAVTSASSAEYIAVCALSLFLLPKQLMYHTNIALKPYR